MKGFLETESCLGFGWFLAVFALLQVPLWGAYVIYTQEGDSLYEVIT